MADKSVLHSICRWTFNAGKGGFVPGDARADWASDKFNTVSFVKLVKEKIRPRLPATIGLGIELHYDSEIDEKTADEVADALVDAKMWLAMITPGAHSHFAYGGICSLNDNERKAAGELGVKTVDIAYGPLKKAWHPEITPTFVLWNGSYGYDLATIGIQQMYKNLKESLASLCKYEDKKGGKLYMAIEPKPNEGHPAMLLPTVASAIVFWKQLEKEFKIDISKKGVNKEFGHSEMIGLDAVYDTVEEIDNNQLVHMHLNSQGYNNGILLGGPGKYDIDHGCRITGMNIAIAGLIADCGFNRWRGHDMQARAYDNEAQGIDRVVRSVLSWEACERAAARLDKKALLSLLSAKETGKAEDMIQDSVSDAWKIFKELYK